MVKQVTQFSLDAIGEFLEQYAERSNDVYWLTNLDLKRIVYVSPAYEKIWGRKVADLYAHPERWNEALINPDPNYNPIAAMAERIEKEGPNARYNELYQIRRLDDGEVRWILDRAFPVYDAEGHCCGVTGVATDITESKQAEEALKLAKEHAEMASKSKTEFLAQVSHELRTPLNGILGNLEMLKNSVSLGSQQNDFIHNIELSSKHLLSLIKDLIDVSALAAGSVHIDPEPFDLPTTITNVYNELLALTQSKGLQFNVIIDQEIPKALMGDARRIRQILINIIGNAIKFTQTGEIKLTAKLVAIKEDIHEVKISIKDTGIGIPADKLEVIFEKFKQLNSGYARTNEGFGLGLAICREIIEKMQGKIDVASQENQGSQFDITLYFTSPPIQEIVSVKNCRILLIEDNLINQTVALHILKSLECLPDIAQNGKEALEKFAQHDYDLILSDLSLPDTDGFTIAKSLRDKNPSIPIIAVTAHSDEITKRKAFQAGMSDFICKPFTQQLLNYKIAKYYRSS